MNSILVFCLLFVAIYANVPAERPIHRIVGGQAAKISQFPYFARLQVSRKRDGRAVTSLCGGALISPRTILTAAHCLEGASSVSIFAGVTKSWPSEPTYQMRGAWASSGGLRQHENYNDTSLENDIALVTFAPDMQLNDAVKVVNLPGDEDVVGKMGVIAGFGKTGTKAPNSHDLLYANRKILPTSSCSMYPDYLLPSKHLCIDGSDNISSCPGDSGGPFVVDGPDGSKTVVGVVSFGAVECDTGFPSIYTKVSAYGDWIRKHMK